MLSYKESLGFSRNSYDYYLRDFCDYFSQNDYSQFTEETVLPWCVRRPTEMPEGFRRRITPLREFSKYLCAIGETDYVVPTSVFPIIHREMIVRGIFMMTIDTNVVQIVAAELTICGIL